MPWECSGSDAHEKMDGIFGVCDAMIIFAYNFLHVNCTMGNIVTNCN